MTPKEFLLLAWQIDSRIERRAEELERLQTKLEAGRAANLSGMPRGGRYDWTDTAAKVADLQREICAEIEKLCRTKRAVNNAIDSVEDMRYRRLLEMRYRNYMTFEQIAAAMAYDVRTIHRLHGKALLRVRVPSEFA